ncbi:unnamed protein product [Closterium sp. Yama58-4]|nr:unnamed protein product [Closterium sp. Yama58-4]
MMSYKRLRPDLLPPPPSPLQDPRAALITPPPFPPTPPHLQEKPDARAAQHAASRNQGPIAAGGALAVSHTSTSQNHLLCPLPPRLPSASRTFRGPSHTPPAQSPAHSSAYAPPQSPAHSSAQGPAHTFAQPPSPANEFSMGGNGNAPLQFAQGLCAPLPPSFRRSPATGAAGLAGRSRHLQRANTAGSSIRGSASSGGVSTPGRLSPSASPIINGTSAALFGMSAGNFGGFSAFDSPSNSPFAADSAVSAASALRRCSTVGAERERPQMLVRDWSADRNSIRANIMFPADYPPELLHPPHPSPPEIFAQACGEGSAAAAAGASQLPRNAFAPAASAPAPSATRGSASPPVSVSAHISVSASGGVFGGGAASSFCRTEPSRDGAQTSKVYAHDIAPPPLAPTTAPVGALLQRGNSGNQMETGRRFAGLKRPSDLTATVISPSRGLGKPPATGAAPTALHATSAPLDTRTVAEAGNWCGSQGTEGRAGRNIPNCSLEGQSYCSNNGGGGNGTDRDWMRSEQVRDELAGERNGKVLALRGGDKSAGEAEGMPALLEQADVDLASLVNGLEEGDSKVVLVTEGTMVDVHHCEDVTKTGDFCSPVTGGEERAADADCNERMDDAGEPDELDTFDLTQMEGLDLPIVLSDANLDEISGISSADFLPDLPEDLFADLPLDAPFDVVTLCEDSSDCAVREGMGIANPTATPCEAPLLRAAPPSGDGRGGERGEAVEEGGAVMGERGEAAIAAPAAPAAAPAAPAAAPAAAAAAAVAAAAAAAAAAGLVGGKRGTAGVNQQMAAAVALNRLLQQRQMLSNPSNPKQQLLLRALAAAATTDSGVPPVALASVIAASAAASGAASAVASAGAVSAGSEPGLCAGLAAASPSTPSCHPPWILEVGCGSGSSALAILRATTRVCLAACDISPTAVSLTTHTLSHALGEHTATHRFRGFVCDVAQGDLHAALASRFTAPGVSEPPAVPTSGESGVSSEFSPMQASPSPAPPSGFNESALVSVPPTARPSPPEFRAALCIFTLSALHPDHMLHALRQIRSVLAPGGLLLFRDYGVFDMVMFRDRLYERGDGTLAYFFSVEEVRVLMGAAGFECEEVEYCCVRNENRRKGREMKRVWVHGVFRKVG